VSHLHKARKCVVHGLQFMTLRTCLESGTGRH
jgi:hypothetical protein